MVRLYNKHLSPITKQVSLTLYPEELFTLNVGRNSQHYDSYLQITDSHGGLLYEDDCVLCNFCKFQLNY